MLENRTVSKFLQRDCDWITIEHATLTRYILATRADNALAFVLVQQWSARVLHTNSWQNGDEFDPKMNKRNSFQTIIRMKMRWILRTIRIHKGKDWRKEQQPTLSVIEMLVEEVNPLLTHKVEVTWKFKCRPFGITTFESTFYEVDTQVFAIFTEATKRREMKLVQVWRQHEVHHICYTLTTMNAPSNQRPKAKNELPEKHSTGKVSSQVEHG
jgi:hypothetical protein